MPHDRNARADQSLDLGHDLPASFQFERPYARLAEKSARVAQSVVRAAFIGQKRHIAHHQRAARGGGHRAGVMQHFVHAYAVGVRTAKHGHGRRISHQNQIGAARLGNAGARRVIGGKHDQFAHVFCIDNVENGGRPFRRAGTGRTVGHGIPPAGVEGPQRSPVRPAWQTIAARLGPGRTVKRKYRRMSKKIFLFPYRVFRMDR